MSYFYLALEHLITMITQIFLAFNWFLSYIGEYSEVLTPLEQCGFIKHLKANGKYDLNICVQLTKNPQLIKSMVNVNCLPTEDICCPLIKVRITEEIVKS